MIYAGNVSASARAAVEDAGNTDGLLSGARLVHAAGGAAQWQVACSQVATERAGSNVQDQIEAVQCHVPFVPTMGVANGESIQVTLEFSVDGQTSTATGATSALTVAGAPRVDSI